jgi:cation/acetate symporter
MTEGIAWIPLTFVILIIAATVWLGLYATKRSKSASDFFVAGRSVSVFWNASAISGEYLSAASFMGIAGLLMKNGYDALWYPVGYATGYLLLLLFIAGPLRRFGAYTIPDFAEGRFDSPTFRKIAVIFVLFIGFFYTMPQMKGAGVTMALILNWPYAVGIVVVGAVITFNVALGGMKGITFVQAFQYWAKVFAISLPVFVLMSVYGGYAANFARNADNAKGAPKLAQETTVKFKGKAGAPANAVAFAAGSVTRITFPKGAALDKVSPARKPEPGEDALPAGALLVLQGESVVASSPAGGWSSGYSIPAGGVLEAHPYAATRSGQALLKDGQPLRNAPKIEFLTDTSGLIAAGTAVPNAQNNKKWSEPFGTMTGKYGHPLLYTYSLILALVCGTAGLPHILVRFYTNPDGRSAKRTTLWVMVLIGIFYLFPPVWGAIGRSVIPILYANNTTDSLVIRLPMALTDNKLLGQILSGITSAGAFAAFMSTFSGLLVSMSGALAHDIYGKMLRPNASQDDQMKAFKVAAILCGCISVLLGLLVQSFDIAMMVGWAFAIAAASYFPLLLLGAWWRGLTRHGAAAGMLLGGLFSLTAIVCSMALDKKWLVWEVSPQIRTLMEQPAIWGVPLSISIMVVVSLMTAAYVPKDIATKMLRLHAPEELGVSKNYIDADGDH